MHEMSLCEGILQVLQDESKKQGFKKVKTIWLEIGDLSSVEIDAMNFGFDVVVKNSIAQNAKLKIIKVLGQAWCMKCCKSVNIKQRFDECPQCGSHQLQVIEGEEMRIKELEVE